jgi:hypothetical protein
VQRPLPTRVSPSPEVAAAERAGVIALLLAVLSLCICCAGVFIAPVSIYQAGKAIRVLEAHGATEKLPLVRVAWFIGWLALVVQGAFSLVFVAGSLL